MQTRDMQADFNKAWNGLKGEGFVPKRGADEYLLETLDGRRCAMGHLCVFPIEGSVDGNLESSMIGRYYAEQGSSFTSSLMTAHDAAESAEDMQARLRKVAADYNLEVLA